MNHGFKNYTKRAGFLTRFFITAELNGRSTHVDLIISEVHIWIRCA